MNCRKCNKDVVRTKLTTRENLYVDDKGKQWNGKLCPPCNTLRLRAAKEMFVPEPVQMTNRKCRRCNCLLPVTHYFNCPDCSAWRIEYQDWTEVCGINYEAD